MSNTAEQAALDGVFSALEQLLEVQRHNPTPEEKEAITRLRSALAAYVVADRAANGATSASLEGLALQLEMKFALNGG